MDTNHGIMTYKLWQSNQSVSYCQESTDRYTYNLRSWLTNIDGQQFTDVLKYEESAMPQWGGNISVMQWERMVCRMRIHSSMTRIQDL